MYKIPVGKKRLNVMIPEKVYQLIERDVLEYGMNKSSIVGAALVEYYKSHDSRSTTGNEAC